jgi:hypothetical protein
MKLIGLSFLAAVTLTGAAVPASAQNMRHVEVSRTTTVTEHRSNYRHNRHQRHKVCRSQWKNHHRVTRCFWR